MFQTIIVGIEGRAHDAEALALARQLGEPGAEIIAANVEVVDRLSLLVSTAPSAAAEGIVDDFTESRVRTEGVVGRAETVGRGLRDLAVGAGADLIVVASSRRGVIGRLFAGDAVRDVLKHAPCPVAVATVNAVAEGPLRRVVVGYDGTQESEAALADAVRLGRRDGAVVSVVAVVEPLVAASGLSGSWMGESIDEQYDVARARLDGLGERYDLHGVITVGRPAHELADAAEGADLLAIGLRDANLLDRILVGSTDIALLHAQRAAILFSPPLRTGAPHVADALDSIAAPSPDEPGPLPPAGVPARPTVGSGGAA